MNTWLQVLLCFGGSVAAGIRFNVPRRAIVTCGMAGVLAWSTCQVLQQAGTPPVAANFAGAFVVAIAAELAARFRHLPVSCFSVPGIIPLVPGLSAYNAMYAFVHDKYDEGSAIAIQTLLIAAAISAGLVMAGSLWRARRYSRKVTCVAPN